MLLLYSPKPESGVSCCKGDAGCWKVGFGVRPKEGTVKRLWKNSLKEQEYEAPQLGKFAEKAWDTVEARYLDEWCTSSRATVVILFPTF